MYSTLSRFFTSFVYRSLRGAVSFWDSWHFHKKIKLYQKKIFLSSSIFYIKIPSVSQVYSSNRSLRELYCRSVVVSFFCLQFSCILLLPKKIGFHNETNISRFATELFFGNAKSICQSVAKINISVMFVV